MIIQFSAEIVHGGDLEGIGDDEGNSCRACPL